MKLHQNGQSFHPQVGHKLKVAFLFFMAAEEYEILTTEKSIHWHIIGIYLQYERV